jgi:hypothetical protein
MSIIMKIISILFYNCISFKFGDFFLNFTKENSETLIVKAQENYTYSLSRITTHMHTHTLLYIK